jgi:hypothetical protein
MTTNNIAQLLHHPGTSFMPICPCDTNNASDTKTQWSAEELHRVMGFWKFCNYKHLLQVSHDGKWEDGGEFPPLLGSCTTIPKAKRGGALDRTKYCYLDAVHMDIAFGDCISIGSFCYALILVDRATWYNWSFGLKDLTSASIILVLALCLFKASAGSLQDSSIRTATSNCSVWQ